MSATQSRDSSEKQASIQVARGQGTTRRGFLSLMTKGMVYLSGLLGLRGLISFLVYDSGPTTQTRINLGASSNYPPGTRTLVAEANAILISQEGGVLALSLICPHLGCLVGETPDGFTCPCHGSRFDRSGGLIRGPARQSMVRLEIEVDRDGNLILSMA